MAIQKEGIKVFRLDEIQAQSYLRGLREMQSYAREYHMLVHSCYFDVSLSQELKDPDYESMSDFMRPTIWACADTVNHFALAKDRLDLTSEEREQFTIERFCDDLKIIIPQQLVMCDQLELSEEQEQLRQSWDTLTQDQIDSFVAELLGTPEAKEVADRIATGLHEGFLGELVDYCEGPQGKEDAGAQVRLGNMSMIHDTLLQIANGGDIDSREPSLS